MVNLILKFNHHTFDNSNQVKEATYMAMQKYGITI